MPALRFAPARYKVLRVRLHWQFRNIRGCNSLFFFRCSKCAESQEWFRRPAPARCRRALLMYATITSLVLLYVRTIIPGGMSIPSPAVLALLGWGYGALSKFSSGSPNPQRLASSDESGIVALAPQSAQFRLTFSTCGGAIIGQKASSMTKVLELQRWQANSFFSCITCPRQRFRSSETNMSGGYQAIHPTSGNTCSQKFT